MDIVERGRRFLDLHAGPGILVLANAWDAGSARVFEQAGMKAIGTSSAGVAHSLGYRDGEFIPRATMLAALERITATVDVPVSADMVAGFGGRPEDAAATVQAVIAAGAVGINLEDGPPEGGSGLVDVEAQVEKIRAARAAADATRVPFVINARTDAYWLKLGDDGERLRASVARGNRYREAGADCIFVPAVIDRTAIGTLVREIDAPINVLAVTGCPPVAELESLGVRRVSMGSGPMRASLMLVRHIAEELRSTGTYQRFHADTIPYPEVDALFGPRG